jgi:hypothetical protein
MWNELPEETWFEILFLLPIEDLVHMKINRRFNNMIYDPIIWKTLLKEWICIDESRINFVPPKISRTTSYAQDVFVDIYREWMRFEKNRFGSVLLRISYANDEERLLMDTSCGISSCEIPCYIHISWLNTYDELGLPVRVRNGLYEYENLQLDFESLYPSVTIYKNLLSAISKERSARESLVLTNDYPYIVLGNDVRGKEVKTRRQKHKQKHNNSKNMKRSNYKIKEKRKNFMKSHKHN